VTPKQAFDDTAARARRLLHLHQALVNIRKYRIRKDWKASFCGLMHWPKDSAIQRVDSKEAIVVLRAGATLGPSDFSSEALDDLLRSALAFGVSALDRYVHERVVKRIVSALRLRDLSRNQQDLTIPAVASRRMAESAVVAQRTGRSFRPANEVRKTIQEALHKRPFQTWREVDYAFTLIGINDLRNQLQARYRVGSLQAVQAQLNSIAARRNRIVHEGDLVRHERGGQVRRHPIDPRTVREALDFLDTLVGHLEHVA